MKFFIIILVFISSSISFGGGSDYSPKSKQITDAVELEKQRQLIESTKGTIGTYLPDGDCKLLSNNRIHVGNIKSIKVSPYVYRNDYEKQTDNADGWTKNRLTYKVSTEINENYLSQIKTDYKSHQDVLDINFESPPLLLRQTIEPYIKFDPSKGDRKEVFYRVSNSNNLDILYRLDFYNKYNSSQRGNDRMVKIRNQMDSSLIVLDSFKARDWRFIKSTYVRPPNLDSDDSDWPRSNPIPDFVDQQAGLPLISVKNCTFKKTKSF